MKILLVDDDVQLATIIGFTLRREGYLVDIVHDGSSALRRWEAEPPDLVLLDANLPGLDGYEVLRRMREVSQVPVVMLTVRGEEEDMVRGLDLGADDYVTKPFSPRTLLARLRAVLRRAGFTVPSGELLAGVFTLDVDRQAVVIGGGAPVRLTPLEYRLLHYLLVNQGQVLTSEMLLEYVWGYDSGDRSLLKQLVRRLRRKIEPDPSTPRYLETVANIGYTLVTDPTGST